MDKSIAVAIGKQSSNSNITPENIAALKNLTKAASEVEPIGRVVGNFTDINILKKTLVLSGDKIYIPKRPTSVTLVGEVMAPGSFLWDKSKNVNSYIDDAAGFTDLASKRKVFIIAPNGQAMKQSGLWSVSNKIKPGTTIVIPRRIDLASNLEKISSVTSVIYQLTLTLAGIDNLLE